MHPPSRLLLFENGAALGVFSDADDQRIEDEYVVGGRGHSAVVMEPSGACFTQVRQDGDCQRHLSDFCRRDLVPQVAAVSTFRNAHSPRPYLSQRIHATSTYPQKESSSSSSSSNNNNKRKGRSRNLPRVAQWPAVAATAGAGGGQPPSSWCTVGADGTVEVRAVSGNARLTLSASRTTAEVDYAVAVPGPPAATPTAATATATTTSDSRVWVTRRFFVGPTQSDVPPEFAHALAVAVALGASSSSPTSAPGPPAAAAAASAAVDDAAVGEGKGWGQDGAAEGVGVRVAVGASAGGVAVAGAGGTGEGLVASELPWPEVRPDHASWDTVVQAAASPPRFDGNSHHPAPLGYFDAGYDWRNVARRAASATAAPTTCATPGLLSVDVMELAEGRGFAGDMAPVVESTRGCTYRVVVVVRGDDGGGGEGGCRDKVSVHVVVHADGTEVWLEGDFVRLVRPRARSPPSGTTTIAPQQQRLLHFSVASTIHFRVPSQASSPPPPPSTSEHAGNLTTAAVAGAPPEACSTKLNPDGFFASSGGGTAATAAAAADRGMVNMSLGDIASRALALRRQFVTYSTASAATGGGGETGTSTSTSTSTALRTRKQPNVAVKIKPPTIFPVVPGGAAAVATTGLSPRFRASAAAAFRAAKSSISETSTTATRWQQQQARSSAAATAAAAAHISATMIVESVERGGASFVAFSDGRARGAFADRTIVTLGARFSYPPVPLREQHLGSNARCGGGGGGGGWRRRGRGTVAAATAVLGLSCHHLGVAMEEQEQDREIECICPDGTVVRLTERSIGRHRQLGCSGTDGVSGRMTSPSGTTGTTGGGHDSFFPAAPAPTIDDGSHGIDTANICSSSRSSSSPDTTVLRPYVVAVLHFAEWAATPHTERRAATEREAAGRMAAAAEAERNRRFVDLQRCLAKPAPSAAPSPPTLSQAKLLNHERTGGSTSWGAGGGHAFACDDGGRTRGGGGGGGGGGGRGRRATNGSDFLLREGGANNSSETRQDNEEDDDDNNKENADADDVFKSLVSKERQRGVVTGPPPPPPQTAQQRNALVARLLDANREILIGKEVPNMLVGPGDL